MKSVIFISVLVFLFSTFGQAQENKFSFKEQYNVDGPAKLKISTSDGDIKVLPGEEGTIEVFYIVHKNGSIIKTSREELEKILSLKLNMKITCWIFRLETKNSLPGKSIMMFLLRFMPRFKLHVLWQVRMEI